MKKILIILILGLVLATTACKASSPQEIPNEPVLPGEDDPIIDNPIVDEPIVDEPIIDAPIKDVNNLPWI